MKKTYVKPIIEMEGFVPNEYVAACYLVTCKSHTGEGSFVYQGEPTREWDADDFYITLLGWAYIGNKLGDKPIHRVDLVPTTKENNPEHPNASA